MHEFQSKANKDGEDYVERCAEALERYGLIVVERKFRLPDCGVELDLVARNRHGITLLIECKGGYNSGKKKGGFESSDNVRKAIGSAYTLSQSEAYTGEPYTPLIVMTTYIMPESSVMFQWMKYTQTCVLADVVNDRDAARLRWWSRIDWFGVMALAAEYPTVDWLLRSNRFWGFQAIGNLALFGATNGN